MNFRFCFPGKLLPYLFYISLLFFLLWSWKPAGAQVIGTFKGSAIGEVVPDVTLKNLMNHKAASAKLSDFRGKLLILDFWATWCKPCVLMIPRMDSLEKQFAGKLQFLPVSYQSAQEINIFRAKFAKRTGRRILGTEVVEDTLLKTLFPHSGVPHYVWIDTEGKLNAITGLEEVTAEKIEKALNGQKMDVTEKKDEVRFSYDSHETPLHEFLSRTNTFSAGQTDYHAVLTGYIPGMQARTSFLKPKQKGQSWRLTYCNENLRNLYAFAYGKARHFFSDNTVSIQVRDSSEFFHLGKTAREWMPQHSYCYELVVPAVLSDSGFSMVQQDLRRLFPKYDAGIEKREKKVLALVRTSKADKMATKFPRKSEAYDGFVYSARHMSIANLLVSLNGIYMNASPFPLVDHTGYKGEIDLDLDVKFSDLSDVNRGLSRYDLQLTEAFEPVDVLVIKDRVHPGFTAGDH